MKVDLKEHDGSFCFYFQAENMADAALVTRIGANAKKVVCSLNSFADKDGSFHGYVVISKNKKADSSIPNRGQK